MGMDMGELVEQLQARVAEAKADPRYAQQAELETAQQWDNICPPGVCVGGSQLGVACNLFGERGCPRVQDSLLRRVKDGLLAMGFGPQDVLAERVRVPDDVRPQLEDYCLHIEENVKAGRGIWICGEPGCGKTSMLALAARRGINRRLRMEYVSSGGKILDALTSRTGQDKLQDLGDAQLLLVDDIERVHSREPWMVGRLDEWIGDVYQRRQAMVIASNVTMERFGEHPELARAADRLREMVTELRCAARSQRVSRG